MKQEQTETSQPARQSLLMAAVLGVLITLAGLIMTASPAAAQESEESAVTAPGAPTGLVLALDNAKLVAGWNPPEDDGGAVIIGYTVQYKTTAATDQASVLGDPAAGWVNAGHSGTSTDTEITDLTNGTSYDVRVRASNSQGDGQWSDTASATPHEDVIWSAILTVSNDGGGLGSFGCVIDVLDVYDEVDECSEALTDDDFAFGTDDYEWTQFSRFVTYDDPAEYTKVGLSALTPEDSNLRKGKFQVGSEVVSLDDTYRVQWFVPDPGTYPNMQWIYSGFLLYDRSTAVVWAEGQRVPLSLQATLPQVQEDETPPGSVGKINDDATLGALSVSDGTNDVPLTPAFASDTTGYTASVDNSVGSVTVTPTVNDENATVTVEGSAVTSGAASSPIALTAGTPKAISVVVTAQNETSKTYTVTVTRAAPAKSSDATLSALAVSDGTNDVPLTPTFAATTTGYTASVENSVSSVTVTPTVNDENATVTVEGSAVTSGTASSPIALTAGTPKAISVVVTAQNGTASTYTVTVTRASPPMSSDATLSALSVSDGTNDVALTPAFASDTTGYTASVANSVASVTVTPTVNDENATVTVEGSAVTSGKASPALSLSVGVDKAIDIVVTAEDGTTNTYTVTVTRARSSDDSLSALTVSDGTNDVPLTPAFSATSSAYAASVDNSVSSVTVTPTTKDPNATVTVEGSTVTSGMASSPIALTAGTPKSISVVVTAQNGVAQKTYTVTVTREEAGELPTPLALASRITDLTLSALAVSDGTNDVPLTPAFAATTTSYTASVENSVGSVTVTPTVTDENATVTVGGSEVTSDTASSPISLTAGVAKVIDIVVADQNGRTNTYTVTVTRENDNTDPATQQLAGSDESEPVGRCRPYGPNNAEGLRVCIAPYEGGEAVLMLTLPGPAPAGGTIVTLATDNGGSRAATVGEDYTMPSAITIGEGKISGLITIAITADGEDEGDETINIYACTRPGCDPLNLVDGEKGYNHGITIPGRRGYGGL